MISLADLYPAVSPADGMSDDTLLKIFEPFYSTKSGGSGLGLPTVRKVIEGHGGRIAIQSEVGRGSQFTLTFPAIPRNTFSGRSESRTQSPFAMKRIFL